MYEYVTVTTIPEEAWLNHLNTLTATRFYSEILARPHVPLYGAYSDIFFEKMIPEEALDAHANSAMQIKVVKWADQEHEIM